MLLPAFPLPLRLPPQRNNVPARQGLRVEIFPDALPGKYYPSLYGLSKKKTVPKEVNERTLSLTSLITRPLAPPGRVILPLCQSLEGAATNKVRLRQVKNNPSSR